MGGVICVVDEDGSLCWERGRRVGDDWEGIM